MSPAPNDTTPRNPSSSSASTTPGETGVPVGAHTNMSLAVVTPLRSIWIPATIVPR
jgi:hypothetical protein